MGVTATNLIQGPATLYLGAFGVTEPATIATVPGAGWTDCGGTKDGVSISIENTWAEMTVDQIVDVIERRKTGRKVMAKTTLAEATLSNLAYAAALPQPITNKISADNGAGSFVTTYNAVLLDGIAPGGFRRRVILRKVVGIDTVETGYKKDDMTVIPVSWAIHYVSPSIVPFTWEDATS